MKQHNRYYNLLIILFYFIVLLLMALWVRDIPHQPDVFRTTIGELIRISKMDDPASFATAAIDIAENGWISPINNWIFNLWPPGFILLESLIITIFGIEAPVVLILQILAVLLFSIVLYSFYGILHKDIDKRIALITPLILFAFPVSRVFLLQPTGITLGESFAIGFFLIGFLIALRAVRQRTILYSALAGLFFALSAYFRSQFEIILLAMTACGIPLIAVIGSIRIKMVVKPELKVSLIVTILITLLFAHIATAPWRIYHLINQKTPMWVTTSELNFKNSVMTSDDLIAIGGKWIVAGAGNLTCRIDPTTCGDTQNARELFIRTFLTHPFEWYSLKFEVIGSYWFSSVKNWGIVGFEASLMDYATNAFLLIALMVIVLYLFLHKIRVHDFWILIVWLVASLYLAYALIITVPHFEVRYFYFPKIVAIMMFLLLSSMYFRRKEKSHQLLRRP